jgi:hypothetical protein
MASEPAATAETRDSALELRQLRSVGGRSRSAEDHTERSGAWGAESPATLRLARKRRSGRLVAAR